MKFPFGFHEDDELRSQFIRSLILAEQIETPPHPRLCRIPKVLVRYWHDAQDVPPDVQACLCSWEVLRRDGFEISTYDDISAKTYIARMFGGREAEAFARCCHPAMRSDYFRLCYVFASGGFYVDADDVMIGEVWPTVYSDDRLKLRPLCYDIPSGGMVPSHDLWDANLDEADRIFYVNNNPLAAPPRHPILGRALERATAALLRSARPRDIQSTTGPGNLTAALAAYAHELGLTGMHHDFKLMQSWDILVETRWDLSYRADERNWRNVDWR